MIMFIIQLSLDYCSITLITFIFRKKKNNTEILINAISGYCKDTAQHQHSESTSKHEKKDI